MPPESFSIYLVLCISAFFAGVMNSVAGGGTLLTFPALLAVVSPHMANGTSTLALMPGSLAGTWGYRREIASMKTLALRLLLPSFLGGLLGSLLLVWDKKKFGDLIPWLILTAAFLFLLQQPAIALMKKFRQKPVQGQTTPATGTLILIFFFQFLVAVYGGYFGAGIGILMLTALGFLSSADMHHLNGVKTFLASIINGIAIVVFVYADNTEGGFIHWHYAGAMAVAAILGGYIGARVARKLPSVYVRWVVIVIGFSLAAYYAFFVQRS